MGAGIAVQIGDMKDKITFGMKAGGVSDNRGGTTPTAVTEIATVWTTAERIKGRRLLQYEKLGTEEVYLFRCYFVGSVGQANLVKYNNRWLTKHSLYRMDEEDWYWEVVAYGKDA